VVIMWGGTNDVSRKETDKDWSKLGTL
jgi:hypothetical protein